MLKYKYGHDYILLDPYSPNISANFYNVVKSNFKQLSVEGKPSDNNLFFKIDRENKKLSPVKLAIPLRNF